MAVGCELPVFIVTEVTRSDDDLCFVEARFGLDQCKNISAVSVHVHVSMHFGWLISEPRVCRFFVQGIFMAPWSNSSVGGLSEDVLAIVFGFFSDNVWGLQALSMFCAALILPGFYHHCQM